MDLGVDVGGAHEEGGLQALQGEFLGGGYVAPGDFDAEFRSGSRVASDVDSGGFGFFDEASVLVGCDAVEDLRCGWCHVYLLEAGCRMPCIGETPSVRNCPATCFQMLSN